MRGLLLLLVLGLAGCATPAPLPPVATPTYDLVIRGGTLIDGTGAPARTADVGISGDRIVTIGAIRPRDGKREISARGKVVAPGFINLLSWATESLLADGRGMSDVMQGVTLELFGEGTSMGPLTDDMRAAALRRQADVHYDMPWTTLGGYLAHLEARGVSPNVASLVGASTVRQYVVGNGRHDPTPSELGRMADVVRQAMREGAFGVGSALIYAPGSFATTAELRALASAAGELGGVYMSHMRSEGDRIDEASDEFLAIARACRCRAQIYHLKLAGKDNWPKQKRIIARLEAARAEGLPVAANAYPYVYAATGFDAAMPPWVQAGGFEAWHARLRDPAIRARLLREMRAPAQGWENLYRHAAGPQNVVLLGFRSAALKPLTGKTLAQVSRMRRTSPEDTIIDLVIEDESRIEVAYRLMKESNVQAVLRLPWVSFGSDEGAPAPEGLFLNSQPHPRAYGTFARVLGHYSRDRHLMPLEEAVHRMTGQPAAFLGLKDRGALAPGHFADVVIFDAARIADPATVENPHQLSRGVEHVWVNGIHVVNQGHHTGATPGRFVRGPAAAAAP